MSRTLESMKSAIRPAVRPLQAWNDFRRLPDTAKAAVLQDREGNLSQTDPGPTQAIDAAMRWLCRAQDVSASADGGVARHFSLVGGWSSSYPETTGYIVPTFLDQAQRTQSGTYKERAKRMLDWLVSIQFDNGAFQGGMVDQHPKVPVTFNTGQILLGLAAGARLWPERYLEPMRKAANFLANTQDDDGCWRSHPTPFATNDDKAYETHVSWGLYEAARVEKTSMWIDAANRQVQWALSHQAPNGWLGQCCLSDKTIPISHTLGYALRGFVESYRFTKDNTVLAAAQALAEGLRATQNTDGRLAGAFRNDWSPAAQWSCLTGSVQIAHSWLLLFQITGERTWRDAATLANGWVRRTLDFDPRTPDIFGAVKGSYPIDGDYCRLEYPNWAAKFLIDSCQLELDVIEPS